MAQAKKPKAAAKKKPAKAASAKAKPRSLAVKVESPKGKSGKGKDPLESLATLIDNPLVADLLAVGAIAAVAAIADHKVQKRSGKDKKRGNSAMKAAGKAAAAAMGRRLMNEVDEIRKAAKKASA